MEVTNPLSTFSLCLKWLAWALQSSCILVLLAVVRISNLCIGTSLLRCGLNLSIFQSFLEIMFALYVISILSSSSDHVQWQMLIRSGKPLFFHYDDNVISTWEILDLILLPHGKTVNLTGIQALSYMYLIVNSKKLCYACDCWRNWPMSGLKFQSLSVQCMVTNPFRICYGQEWQQSFMTRFLLKVTNS